MLIKDTSAVVGAAALLLIASSVSEPSTTAIGASARLLIGACAVWMAMSFGFVLPGRSDRIEVNTG